MSDVSDIIETFDLLGDWDQRYQYLVELGERLPAMPDAAKTDDNRVKPCMSKVWVQSHWDRDTPSLIRYHGDCDTSIIKGVLALLIDLCSGKSNAQIQALDFDALFHRLQLDEHLSPNRHVGIYAIVARMKSQAARLAEQGARLAS